MSAVRSRKSGSHAVWLLAAFVLAAVAGCATPEDDLAGDAAAATDPVAGEAEGPLVFARCSNGARRCNGRRVQTCRNGRWVNGSTCAYVCSSGRCTGQCTPGARRCRGKTPQTCNQNGQWVSAGTCPYICQDGQCTSP